MWAPRLSHDALIRSAWSLIATGSVALGLVSTVRDAGRRSAGGRVRCRTAYCPFGTAAKRGGRVAVGDLMDGRVAVGGVTYASSLAGRPVTSGRDIRFAYPPNAPGGLRPLGLLYAPRIISCILLAGIRCSC